MEQKYEILKYLSENEMENINMINFIKSYPIHTIDKVGSSVIIRGTSDRDWIYISCKSLKELEMIKQMLNKNDRCFAIIEDWMVPILTAGRNLKWKLSAMRLILPSGVFVPAPAHELSTLSSNDAEFIYKSSNYIDFLSIEYTKERIINGISSCIRIENKLAAWAITQDDGAIGFLHVLPEYRRKGFGRGITLDMVCKVRNAGMLPFVHIEEDNYKSMRLALSLGFKKDRVVNWFEIE